MSRSRPTSSVARIRTRFVQARHPARRRALCGWLAASAFVLAWLAPVLEAAASSPVRVAVAPFAGDRLGLRVADRLTERLAQRPVERVIAPEAFVARAAFEPVPGEVRQWAYNAAVDAVIVGRVHDAANGGGWRVEAALRSGHSGAEFARHLLDVELGDSAEAALDRLAVVLLSDLGYRESPEAEGQPWRDPRSPEPPVLPGSTAGEGASEESGGGLGGALGIGGLREQEAIEINAEEAEIVDRGEARRLVFQRNVRVRQGDVSLNSDVVEAEYRKGESEPDRLIARGSVEVGQGQRRARCDEAVYQRNENRISCVGHAELVQGCDVVRGDAIEFDLSGERARVVGAASIVIREGEPGGVVCTGIGGEAP